MSLKIRVSLDPAGVLALRGLGEGREAQRFLAAQVLSRCDARVPMRTGALKNGAYIAGDGNGVIYPADYAQYQYRGVIASGSRAGEPLRYGGAPMRGGYWDRRMIADEGAEVVRALAAHMGGRAKWR